MTNITDTYPGRVGEALDIFLNVLLLRGRAGQTISLHAAEDAPRERWACWLCRWLSLTVERDHCAKTLAGESISERGGLLAGGQLIVVFLLVTRLLWWLL